MSRSLNQSGQTLVDLVVALALISSTVASAGVLSTTSNRVARDAGHRTEAMALAVREMEGLRSYRDTFERNGVDWNTTLLGVPLPNCSNFVMTLVGNTTVPGSDWTATDIHSTTPVSYDPTRRGFDGGDATLAAKYEGFSRSITTCPAYDYQQTDFNLPNPSGPLNRVSSSHIRTVVVTVQWLEGNRTNSVTQRSMIGDYGQ